MTARSRNELYLCCLVDSCSSHVVWLISRAVILSVIWRRSWYYGRLNWQVELVIARILVKFISHSVDPLDGLTMIMSGLELFTKPCQAPLIFWSRFHKVQGTEASYEDKVCVSNFLKLSSWNLKTLYRFESWLQLVIWRFDSWCIL